MERFEVLAYWESLNVKERVYPAEFAEIFFNQDTYLPEIKYLLTIKEKMVN